MGLGKAVAADRLTDQDGYIWICKMSKQKTKKSAAKRFKITGTGKVKHRSAGTSHLASRRSKKRRRQLRGTDVLSAVEAKRVIPLIKS